MSTPIIPPVTGEIIGFINAATVGLPPATISAGFVVGCGPILQGGAPPCPNPKSSPAFARISFRGPDNGSCTLIPANGLHSLISGTSDAGSQEKNERMSAI